MSASPSDEEIAILARHAGLDLPPPYLAELADAYRHILPMLMRLRRSRPRGDEPSQVFAAGRHADGAQ